MTEGQYYAVTEGTNIRQMLSKHVPNIFDSCRAEQKYIDDNTNQRSGFGRTFRTPLVPISVAEYDLKNHGSQWHKTGGAI